MLFNSYEYILFFPFTILIFYILPNKFRNVWLLLASYVFYMGWNAKYSLLLLAVTLMSYISGRIIRYSQKHNKNSEKFIVIISLTVLILLLCVFKYFNFIIDNINFIINDNKLQAINVILPVGISFYLFQAMGYIIDVYKSKVEAETNFLDYALFLSFFPQLVAGPIERSKNLLNQIKSEKRFDFEKAQDGVFLMIWGYFLKMVIADRIAIFVDTIYGDIKTYSGCYLVIATLLFAIQIYCDFAGYSTIAMGSAKVLGFELMDNFDAPYCSSSVKEFWRRWHISLTSWFKDYLYIPLGGSHVSESRKYINTLIVFLVSGLWHGAAWGFVIWGALNGAYQIIGEIKRKYIKEKNSKVCKIVRTIVVFFLIDFSWIFFRSQSMQKSLEVINGMIKTKNWDVLIDGTLCSQILSLPNFVVMMVAIAILLVSDIMKYNGICIRKWLINRGVLARILVVTVSVVCIFIFGIYGAEYDATGFIYFQF